LDALILADPGWVEAPAGGEQELQRVAGAVECPVPYPAKARYL
jgi:hypothetical protein